jgi:hypothetical protein
MLHVATARCSARWMRLNYRIGVTSRMPHTLVGTTKDFKSKVEFETLTHSMSHTRVRGEDSCLILPPLLTTVYSTRTKNIVAHASETINHHTFQQRQGLRPTRRCPQTYRCTATITRLTYSFSRTWRCRVGTVLPNEYPATDSSVASLS